MSARDPNLDERGHVRRGTTWTDASGRRFQVGGSTWWEGEVWRVFVWAPGSSTARSSVATPAEVRALYDRRHKPTHEAESLQTQRRRRRGRR